MNCQDILNGTEKFIEKENEVDCINDLLSLWDLFITIPKPSKTNLQVMYDITNCLSVKNMAHFFKILATYTFKKHSHPTILINYDKTIGEKFISYIRGEIGTEEEQKIANDYIDVECDFSKFLKNRVGSEMYSQ